MEYFIGCLIFLSVWIIFFVLRKDLRKEMIFGSLLAAPFGLIESLWVPEYWNPPSLFNLMSLHGFGVESLLFFFICGGISAVVFEIFSGERIVKMKGKNKFLFWSYLPAILVFFILDFIFPENTIHILVIALLFASFMVALKRKDLISQMIFGGISFAAIYFLFFFIFSRIYPDYVSSVYSLENMFGIIILGVPLEEILVSFSAGAVWSCFYESIMGYRTK